MRKLMQSLVSDWIQDTNAVCSGLNDTNPMREDLRQAGVGGAEGKVLMVFSASLSLLFLFVR